MCAPLGTSIDRFLNHGMVNKLSSDLVIDNSTTGGDISTISSVLHRSWIHNVTILVEYIISPSLVMNFVSCFFF